MPERPLVIPPAGSNQNSNILIPGAREARNPIIPNITKHTRKTSVETKQLASYDNSVQETNSLGGLQSGRLDQAMPPQH